MGLWTRWHMNRVMTILFWFFVFKLIKWFLDPYFKYRQGTKHVKDYESF